MTEIDFGNGLSYAKSFYLLGEADKGPTNTPTLIRNENELVDIFGDNRLTQAWRQAYQTMGSDVNIYLTRINGTQANMTLYARSVTDGMYEAIRLKTCFSGEAWNETTAMFTDEYLQLSNPTSVQGEYLFFYDDYPTQGMLVNAINEACSSGYIGIRASATSQFSPTYEVISHYESKYYEPIYFVGGTDELNNTKNELHELLTMTYNILEGQKIDILSVVDVNFDDVSPLSVYGESSYGEKFYVSDRDYLDTVHLKQRDRQATFHGQVIDFCKKQQEQNILTHCVMAFNPVEAVEDILIKNSYSIKASNGTCLSDRFDIVESIHGRIVDNGKYLSIVTGEFKYQDTHGMYYYDNAYIAYGAYLAGTLTSSSSTNKVIPNCSDLRYHLDDDEIEYLGKLGVVTFRKSILKDAIVVGNGVTAALFESPFHVVSNVRMFQLIQNAYNSILQAYVGENVNRLRKTQAMEKTIDTITKALISDGVAKNIKTYLEITDAGIANLEIDVLCNYSIEYVKATTNIKL